jgi:hypothetical protein
MHSRVSRIAIALTAGIAAVALVPAIAQRGPQSILPPGFGEPDPPPPPPAAPKGTPKSNEDRPSRSSPERERDTQDVPELTLRPPVQSTSPSSGGGSIEDIGDDEGGFGNSSDNASVAMAPPQDLPPQARRSLDQVGLLPAEDGGFGPGAFGDADGRYLTTMMVRAKAPVASRWASILLRRALLSQSSIPANINGADWVAHRAWLLVRMGEAENARSLVQRVDSDNFTPWLYEAAMQASLAAADPSSMCGSAGSSTGLATGARHVCGAVGRRGHGEFAGQSGTQWQGTPRARH